jgi:outer membrane protein OmpA-like peptidoglycan-associated protein
MRAFIRGKKVAASLLACLVFVVGSPDSKAQTMDIPFDPAIDVQLFDYAIGPKSFLTVVNGEVTSEKQFNADFLVTFLTDPFTIFNVETTDDEIIDTRANVVEQLVAGQITGSYGVFNRFHIGISIPIIFSMSGDGLGDVMNARSVPGDDLQATGLGDIRLEVKMKAWEKEQLKVAWTGSISAPTSFGAGGSDYLGDNLPSLRGVGALQWTDPQNRFTAGANLGVIFRKPRDIYSSTVGQQITYALAGAYFVNDRFNVIAETFGRSGFNLDLDESPLEVVGGLRIRATDAISVLAGGGAGVRKGIGSPGLRMFAAVGYAPDFRDSDGDGINNQDDKCPLVAEDKDNYEDLDGCPDLDNDGDRRPDTEDKCPMKTEDLDGFEDDDGCPEPDNDMDGFLDGKDRCPQDKEDGAAPFDKDGCPANKRDSDDDGLMDSEDKCPEDPEDTDDFEDWDGCPEEDNDMDGIIDEDDKCPVCVEDSDGFEDDDGCPEIDNDRDGILDNKDQCPTEAEVINGVDDFDGCPDSGGNQVAALDGNRIAVTGDIKFSGRGKLRSTQIVDQVAAVMLSRPEVATWRVVVAMAKGRNEVKAKEKAQARADTLKGHLMSRGVPGTAIEAVGTAADAALTAFVVLSRIESGDAEAMCPPNARVKPRQPGTEAAMPDPSDVKVATDTDGDGVMDASDVCADRPGPVENRGCPDTDIDEDGVVDRMDNCPDEKGTAKNQGCKKKQLVVLTQNKIEILDKVYFKTNKAKIQRRSNRLLNNVASVLNAHPEIKKINVEGHTDAQGDDASNKDLSQRRAQAVVDYLVKKGVDVSRLEAMGFGEEKPIDSNDTKDGRAANRRVEFNIADMGGPIETPVEETPVPTPPPSTTPTP